MNQAAWVTFTHAKKEGGSGNLVLHQLDIGDIVLPLCKNFCLKYIFPCFPDSKPPIFIAHLHAGDRLILRIGYEVDIGDMRGEETVPDELIRVRRLLHDFNPLP